MKEDDTDSGRVTASKNRTILDPCVRQTVDAARSVVVGWLDSRPAETEALGLLP